VNDSSWYAVQKVKDTEAEIAIYDEIGLFGVTAKEFTSELKSLGNRRILLRIHSPGGEIFDGQVVFNALRRHPGGVDVAIDGLAASMASVIAMVGEKRSMAENAMMMIHNPWTVSFGEAEDMRKSADLLDKLKENIISAYAGRTGIKREELGAMMDEETWMTAKEAKDFGFITDITERLNVYNSFERFDISQFSKRPRNFMSKKSESKPEVIADVPAVIEASSEIPEIELSAEEKVVISLKEQAALVPGLQAELLSHKEEILNLGKEVTEKTDQLKALSLTYDRLKRSLAIAPAAQLVETPVAAERKSLADQYDAIVDDAEKTAFFREHKAELQQLVNKAPKA
jgi:ATP-dependent Clp endopeptidase proteolytic subunit ClpP